MYRFYNGGDAIREPIPYSKPSVDVRTSNNTAYWYLNAEAKSFFELPEMVRVDRGAPAITNFDLTVASKWGPLGVVLVDPTRTPEQFGYPVARTDAEAKERGDQINQEYLVTLVQAYINDVEEKKARGLTALPAQGYTKRALARLGIADPALVVRHQVEKAVEHDRIKALEAQLAQLLAAQQTQKSEKTAK